VRAWMFVAWGAFHGVLLVAHQGWNRATGHFLVRSGISTSSIWTFATTVAFFHVICFGLIFFRASNPAEFVHVLSPILDGDFSWGRHEWNAVKRLLFFCSPILALDLFDELYERRTSDSNGVAMSAASPVVRGVVISAILFLLFIAGAPDGQEFVYFQF
jgi:alginate O-acetyltransferase complex protein AlgI